MIRDRDRTGRYDPARAACRAAPIASSGYEPSPRDGGLDDLDDLISTLGGIDANFSF
jgi:hypothetical protein